jgi:hypothetical protein
MGLRFLSLAGICQPQPLMKTDWVVPRILWVRGSSPGKRLTDLEMKLVTLVPVRKQCYVTQHLRNRSCCLSD